MGQDPRNGLQTIWGSWETIWSRQPLTILLFLLLWWTTTGVVLVVLLLLLLLLLLSLRITLGEGGGDPSSAATAHPDATATLKAEHQLQHCVLCMSMLDGALLCFIMLLHNNCGALCSLHVQGTQVLHNRTFTYCTSTMPCTNKRGDHKHHFCH